MKIKTNLNSADFKRGRELPTTKPDLAVPDQSLTIGQVLTKYASGTLPSISKNPQYDSTDENKVPDMDNISPFRRQNYDLADYTSDSLNNSHTLVSNKNRVRDLEKQIVIQKALDDEAKKAKDKTTTVND